jgi:hypothetical protein
MTNGSGHYQFPREGKLIRTADWWVAFDGSVEGTHPNIHTCRASESDHVTITVSG